MASDGGVTAKLASAKKALENADKSNVSTKSGHPFGSPAPAPKPHEFSHAPYSLVQQAKDTGSDVAHGIAANKKNVSDYVEATKQ
jgi:hypothetical protein